MKSADFRIDRRLTVVIFTAIILIAVSTGLYFGVRAFNPELPQHSIDKTGTAQNTPVPVVDLKVEGMEFPDQALVGEEFCYTTRIENVGDVPGFGPSIVIALPGGMMLSSASLPGVSGTPMGTPASNFPIAFQGPLTNDPLNQQPPLAGNYNYYVIPAPIGSLFAGMPGIDLKLCVKVDVNMTPDVPVPVCHTPYFQFGDSALGSTPIKGERICNDLTPVLVKLDKKILAPTSNKKAPLPTNEVVTGCTAYTFQLNANIAKDITLIDLVFTDMLPDELVFVPGSVTVKGLSIPTIPVTIVDNTNPGGGGTLTVTINDDTGVSGPNPDVTVEFKAFVKNFLDKGSCDTRVISNKATLDALNGGSDPIKQQTVTLPIEVEHVAIQKSASGPRQDPLIVVPGDTVDYRLDFQVSQDITANIQIEDLLPNGIQFNTGSAVLACANGFNGPITPGALVDKHNGTTLLNFNIGQSPGCTSCSLTYKATVNQSYASGSPVRAADLLVNTAKAKYSIEGGAANCVEDTLGAVLVHPVTISKTIKNPKAEYIPGDLVRFSLKMTIPSGDTKSISFIDFLPLPIFEVTGTQPFNIQLGGNHNVGGTFTVDKIPGQNAVMFTFNDVTTTGNPVPCIEIEFSVLVTTNPFADDLYLTNLFQAFTTNTNGEVQSLLTGVSLHVRAPKLKITKGVFSALNPNANITPPSSNPVDGNVTGVDGGDKITFYITVKNEGGAPAYSVEITDILPSPPPPPPQPTPPPYLEYVPLSGTVVSGPPANITINGQTITIKFPGFPSLQKDEISVISFMATVKSDIAACQQITNTASVRWRNVYDPEVIGPPLPPLFPAVSDSAVVTTAGPRVTKTVVGTNYQHTPGTDVTIGETVTYKVDIEIPEGTTGGVMVMDQLPTGLAIPGSFPFSITAGSSTSLSLTGSLTSAPINAPGDKISFNFGSITNSDSNNSVKEVISFTYNAFVLDVTGNQNGAIISNNVTVSSTRCPAITTAAPIRIVEPKLQIAKEFVPSTAAAGDKVQIKLTVTNVGASDAFDIRIEDVLNTAFSGIGAITTPTGFSFSLNGQTVSYVSGAGVSIKPGDNVTFIFEVTVRTCGQVSNLARVTQATTLPGVVAGERDEPEVDSNTATLTVDGNCPCVDPPQFGNMVGWWPLDESAGATVINDLTGQNPGVPKAQNAASILYFPNQGKVAGALQFNNGYIEVFDSNSLDIGTNGLTIDAWVKPFNFGPPGGPGQVIVDKYDFNAKKGYAFLIDSAGYLQLLIGDGVQPGMVQSGYKLTAGNSWHHLTVTVGRTQTTTPVKFYVDGVVVSDHSSYSTTFGDISNTKNLIIGGGIEILLDEIEIFNAALTESEINGIVTAGSSGKCKCPKTDLTAGKALSTGVNDNGTLLPVGSQDQDYALTLQNGSTTIPVVLTPNPAWVTSSNAAWIGPAQGSGQNTVQTFKYSININLPACNSTGLSIKGKYAADNSAYILVNNDQTQLFPTVSSTGFRQFVDFEITSGLQAGQNTLTFVVKNDSGVTGLLVEITEACIRCCCPEISIAPESLPAGSVNTPYPTTNFTAAGGMSPYTFSLTGNIPPGLTLTSGGVLSGTPASPGTYTFIVTATDAKGCKGSRAYTIVIQCPLVDLKAQKRLFNTGVDNNDKLLNVNQFDGHYPVTDSVDQISLPKVIAPVSGWATLPNAGWIAPFQSGIDTYRYKIKLNLGGCESQSVQLVGRYSAVGKSAYIQVNDDPTQLFPHNDPTSLTQFVLNGLNPGMNVITFVVESGDFRPALLVEFIRATGRCCGCPERFTFTPDTLQDGKVNTPYPATSIAVSGGGYAPYTYAITSGNLPAGMMLASDGTLSGTPTEAGNFTIIVTATDKLGCSKPRQYKFKIRKRDISWSTDIPPPTGLNATGNGRSKALNQQTRKLNVMINLEALGDEHAVSFSLGFDPAVLSNPVISPGKDAVGAAINTNTSEVGQGNLGVSITLPGNQVFVEGLRTVALVQFDFAGSNAGAVTSLGFKDQPVQRLIIDAADNQLTTEYIDQPVLLAPRVTSVSAANYAAEPLAPEQILAAFGTNLATATTVATELPLPTALAGTTVNVRDSSGTERAAQLFFVSPNQVNYLMPAGLAPGQAVVTIKSSDGGISGGIVGISNIAPGLFTVDATGKGVVSSNALTLKPDNTFIQQPTSMFDPNLNKFVSVPIGLGMDDDRVFLVLYGTGLRLRSSEANVRAQIGGFELPVLYAGPQGVFAGLDQINIELPRALAGLGEIEITLIADGVATNLVQINIL